jgi:peptide-methionine (S)-S-oxide reductase
MLRKLLIALTLATSSTVAIAETEEAFFAGGCFWCMESDYEGLDGVTAVVSGFIGGTLKNPTYSGNHKGHYEAVKVTYDADIISYQRLLEKYWLSVDPFDNSGQFCDKGPSYRAAIFADNQAQKKQALASLEQVEKQFQNTPVYTEVLDANQFWPVEEYHQDYYLKNPVRYKYYRWNCGRDQRLKAIWGDAAEH